ncbi:putative oocyte-testis protein 1, partial [Operophtera brumata]
ISNEPNDQLKDEHLDPKSEVLRLQIESLERLLLEQRKENSCLTERVQQQIEELQARDQNYKDLEGQLDSDAAVMRYASVECAAIEARRAAESARRAERAARAELDLLSGKLKSAHGEKQRIIQLYDDKLEGRLKWTQSKLRVEMDAYKVRNGVEVQNSERELSKVRDEFKELEGRLKWTQSKLRVEMDAYKVRNGVEVQNSERELSKVRDEFLELEGRLKWTQSKLRVEMDAYKVRNGVEVQNSERELSKVRDEFLELEGRLKWTQSKLRVEMDAYKAARDAAAVSATDAGKARLCGGSGGAGGAEGEGGAGRHAQRAARERIVSLQRAAARRSERCDFLEEHSKQLTEELRSKSRLLRQLLCSLPAGAVTSSHTDINKMNTRLQAVLEDTLLKNITLKKQIASLGGGAMAALWGGAPGGMTLELSLEMNTRLQAVLEDTLLKNITLKYSWENKPKKIKLL